MPYDRGNKEEGNSAKIAHVLNQMSPPAVNSAIVL